MYTELTYEYINGLCVAKDERLNPILDYAKKHNVPIMQDIVKDFICTQVAMKKPKKILEVGTAIGYSGSCMLLSCDGELTTMELLEEGYEVAKDNFEKLGLTNRVTQVLGDAKESINDINDTFDFIFLDYAKGQYIHLLPELLKRLNSGGVLVADNVLFRGYVSGEKNNKRMRTIIKRMNSFLEAITSDKSLKTSILPFCDGVSVSVKE